ncbi:MAG: DUF1614 domain-containing protein [Methylocystis sp.]
MHLFGSAQFLSLSPQAVAALAGLLLVVVLGVETRTRHNAPSQFGLSPRSVLLVLFVALLGSAVDIPIVKLGHASFVVAREVGSLAAAYRLLHSPTSSEVVLAVNLGGAITPSLLSLSLIARHGVWAQGILVALLVAVLCYALAEPIRGAGIALPISVASIAAALIALLVGWRHAPPLAYAGGSLGVLIGADLANLEKMRGLGVPMLSIGGAGVFDGIFIAGAAAMLLAGLTVSRAPLRA